MELKYSHKRPLHTFLGVEHELKVIWEGSCKTGHYLMPLILTLMVKMNWQSGIHYMIITANSSGAWMIKLMIMLMVWQ